MRALVFRAIAGAVLLGVYVAPAGEAQPPAAPNAQVQATPPNGTVDPNMDNEKEVYSVAIKLGCPGLHAYLTNYPKGKYRDDAQARIAKGCGSSSSTGPAIPPPAGTPEL